MIQSIVALFGIAALLLMSVWASGRFGGHDRLPMQWGFDGSVSGTASRAFALAFTPVLGSIVIIAVIVMTLIQHSTPEKDAYVLPDVAVITISFVALHGLHLWLIGKSLSKDR